MSREVDEFIALDKLWRLFKEHPELAILMAENGFNVDLAKLNELRQVSAYPYPSFLSKPKSKK